MATANGEVVSGMISREICGMVSDLAEIETQCLRRFLVELSRSRRAEGTRLKVLWLWLLQANSIALVRAELGTWVDAPLTGRKLAGGMSALEPYKDKLTLIQGLSGRMMGGNHEAGFGALGAYNAKRWPRDETIDWALAKHLGEVVPHVGLTMDQFGKSVTYPNLSASAPCYRRCVLLHAVTRRGDDLAFYAHLEEASGDPESASARLVADLEIRELAFLLLGDAADRPLQRVLGGGDAAVLAGLGVPVGLEQGDDGFFFMDVESDIEFLRCV